MVQRINSIDSLRYIAMIAVVFLHCFPATGTLKFVVDQLCRFAVPYFFVASGYFLGLKLIQNDRPQTYLKFAWHICKLYLVWTVIYFLNPNTEQIRHVGLLASYAEKARRFFDSGPLVVIFQGFMIHFWFFNSLIWAALVLMIFKLKNLRLMIILSAVLYATGAFFGAYSANIFGFELGDKAKYFILFSGLPFSLGVYVAKTGFHVSDLQAFGMFLLGLVFHFTEEMILGMPLHDYVFSTFLMGLGLFLIGSNDQTSLKSSSLAYLGRLAFGIYAIHILIAVRLYPILGGISVVKPVLYIVYPLLVLIFSTFVIWFLKSWNFSRKIGLAKFV